MLGLKFTNVTVLLTPSFLQYARQAELNYTVMNMGQRKTKLAMGRTPGNRLSGREKSQALGFVSHVEVLLRL